MSWDQVIRDAITAKEGEVFPVSYVLHGDEYLAHADPRFILDVLRHCSELLRLSLQQTRVSGLRHVVVPQLDAVAFYRVGLALPEEE